MTVHFGFSIIICDLVDLEFFKGDCSNHGPLWSVEHAYFLLKTSSYSGLYRSLGLLYWSFFVPEVCQ